MSAVPFAVSIVEATYVRSHIARFTLRDASDICSEEWHARAYVFILFCFRDANDAT